MANIHQYLEALALADGYELCIEPNKLPVVLSDSGSLNLGDDVLPGTEISKMVFPLIPNNVKQKLPDSPEVEFLYETDAGDFNFLVRKSPAGFNVIVTRPPAGEMSDLPSSPIPETFSAPINNVIPDATVQTANSAETHNAETRADYTVPTNPVYQDFSAERSPSSSYTETAADYNVEKFENHSPADNYLNVEVVEPANNFSAPLQNNYRAAEASQKAAPQYSENFSQPTYPQHFGAMPPQFPQYNFFPPQPGFQASAAEESYTPSPQMKSEMDSLFRKMAEIGASDLHLSVSMPPLVRKDGKMQSLETGKSEISAEQMKELLFSIMPAKNREEFNRRRDTDFAYEIEGLARFRANVFMDRKGAGGVFRIIPSKILTAEQLGLSQAIMNLCELSKGLVVVTGPTGSGKSTTLCAMIDSINKKREDHIITIEDPIEFTHENQKCLVNQREVHNHTDSFKDALRAALREDPDILLVGEMRDLETISIAIETAETGHLVFGTLHTITAASTVDRIIDQFPADRQQQIRVMLSESLKGVIAQTLLPKKGGGRIAALEILIVTPAISNLIREGKTFQIPSAMQTGKAQGMIMLNDALFALVQQGAVEPRDAYIKAVDKTGFESLLTRGGFKI